MKATAVQLRELITEARPGFASGDDLEEGIFQVRMNNVGRDGSLRLGQRRRVSTRRNLDQFLLKPGDILFNATNSPDLVGKTAYFEGCDEPAVFSNHFVRLRVDAEKLDPRYLARWLHYEFRRGFFKTKSKQWVNQASFDIDSLLRLSIDVPPLGSQRRAVELLATADALRSKRQRTLDKLDRFFKAAFNRSFGALRQPALPRRSIGQVASVVTGNTPSRSTREHYGMHLEWLKSDNILESGYITPAREHLSELGRSRGREAPIGASLVVCIAGSRRSIGRVGLLDRAAAFNQQINAVIPGPELLPEFLFHQLRASQPAVQRASTNSMKGMVSKSALAAVEIVVPPLAEQSEFVDLVERATSALDGARCSLARIEALSRTLEHRAFMGP